MTCTLNDLPIEIQLYIFGWLQDEAFDAILNYRLVCKHWNELISDFLHHRNCLVFTDSSLSVFENTIIKFSKIRYGKEYVSLSLERYVEYDAQDMMAHLGETVTHLDLTGFKGFALSHFVKNFGSFKVLKHLELESPKVWCGYIFDHTDLVDESIISNMLKYVLLGDHEANPVTQTFPTKQDFDTVVGNQYEDKDESIAIILKVLQEHSRWLNYSAHMRIQTIRVVADMIVSEIKDMKKPKYTNTSVTKLSLGSLDSDTKALLKHLPKLEEIHIKTKDWLQNGGEVASLIKSVTVDISSARSLSEFKMPNLKHVNFWGDIDTYYFFGIDLTAFEAAEVETAVVRFPTIESIGIFLPSLDSVIFPELLTKLQLKFCNTVQAILNSLQPLKNLTDLEIFSWQDRIPQCIFGHEVVQLPKLHNFLIYFPSQECCIDCFSAFLKSFTNLKNLNITANLDKFILNTIWTSGLELKSLKLRDTGDNVFRPNPTWPSMPHLTFLTLKFSEIFVEVPAQWDIFCKKLYKLKIFEVSRVRNRDVMHFIKDDLPMLKVLNINPEDVNPLDEPEVTEEYLRNGKLLYIKSSLSDRVMD